MALYKNHKQADIKMAKPGYSTNAFLTPLSHLQTIQDPVISEVPVIGEKYSIGTSHVYVAGKKSIEVFCPLGTIEAPGEMVGDSLAKDFRWTPKVVLVGDGPEVLELVNNLINGSFLLHLEDAKKCEDGTGFIQFGSRCTPCTVVEGSFVSGVNGEGRKQYEFTLETFDKFFYTGAIESMA